MLLKVFRLEHFTKKLSKNGLHNRIKYPACANRCQQKTHSSIGNCNLQIWSLWLLQCGKTGLEIFPTKKCHPKYHVNRKRNNIQKVLKSPGGRLAGYHGHTKRPWDTHTSSCVCSSSCRAILSGTRLEPLQIHTNSFNLCKDSTWILVQTFGCSNWSLLFK